MKKIKIFLASSITEFAAERMEIEQFIRSVSDDFEDKYNVKLQPYLCEHMDPAYTLGRKQEEYNDVIRGCDFCFFIFFTKAGEYTREEFEVARAQFEAVGKPKIYTYFKVVAEGEAEQSLRDFIAMLDQELGHYYSSFSHIDTVKLRILLSIKLQEMDFLEIKAEDGHCVVDGQAVLPLTNVAEFANNQQLAAMQRELAELEEEYFALKAQYHSRVGDTEFYRHYSQIASRRQTLMDEIAELQGLIFNLSLQMVKDDTHGDVSPRQKKAYQLFEQGDYEGCMAVLDAADIDSDFLAQRKRIQEQARKQEEAVCRKYIREHKTAIDILMAMKKYDGRFAEIEERYEKILPVIFEMGIELETAKEYVRYLIHQNKDAKVLPFAEQLLEHCTEDADKADTWAMLAVLYQRLNHPSKADASHRQSIAIHESLAVENPDRFNPGLANSYNNAGIFYKDQGQPNKAEVFYLKAIEIYQALATANPDRFNPDLASCYHNAGVFYHEQGQPDKAEALYLKAIAIRESLATQNPDRHNHNFANSCNSAGMFFAEQGKPHAAETCHLKAISIYESLAVENPDRFCSDLAICYNNAGNFYQNQNDPDQAEAFYLKAIAICEAIVDANPDRYNPTLANCYNNIGVLYYRQKQVDKTETFYLKAIAIREVLAAKNPDRFHPDLASSYYNAGIFYKNQRKPDKAEAFYLKAIAIYEVLAAENPDRFNSDLVCCYNNTGIFYSDLGQHDKAEEFYLKAIAIREVLAAEKPDRYNPGLADSYNNTGNLYAAQGQYDKAEEFYLKAIAIREVLAAENPDRYNPDLALSYNNAGATCKKQGHLDKAEEFFHKAYLLYQALAEKQPQKYLLRAQLLFKQIKNRQQSTKH